MGSQDVLITIHGREYRISSFKDAEYTRKLARYCDGIMKSIEAGTSSADYLKLLVLSLLQVSHNYLQEAERKGISVEKIDYECMKILKSIQKAEKEIAGAANSPSVKK